MAEAADYTFFATDYDPEKGSRACRGLADAFAAGREPRSEEVREAMAAATAAFPASRNSSTQWTNAISTPRTP